MQTPMILITGPKHAGKTEAARAVASLRGGRFIDLDQLIETRTGKTPRALYREGSGLFQAAEAAALEALISERKNEPASLWVVAPGGGLIDNQAALALLTAAAGPDLAIVYLEVSAGTAWRRISRPGNALPPFLDTDNPEETHRRLHERRGAAYRRLARLVVDGEGKTPEEIALAILRSLELEERP